jgi:periplasmic copper chaperone A
MPRTAQDIRLSTPAALRALAVALLCCCSSVHAQALSAQDAWIRATPGTEVAAAYLTLHNGGTQPLLIVGVRSPRAQQAMIHETTVAGDGRSSMRPHERLRVGAGETVRLAPGGLHIMLHMLTRPLTPGEEVPLLLLLEGGASLTVMARVRALGDD